MSNKEILKNYLSSLSTLVDKLSDADFTKLESGDYELSLKVTKKSTKSNSPKEKLTPDSQTLEMVIDELKLVKTREDGISVIESHLKNKPSLELLAKHLDVAVLPSDKVAKIKDTIVDATVGARLRSGAIQGKEI